MSSATTARRQATRQRIGLSPLGFLELSPPSFVELAGQAGFDAVALRLRSASPGGLAHPLRVGDAPSRATLDAVRATGVTVEHVEVLSLGEDDVARDRPLLEAAAALGARRVLATGDHPDTSLVADRLAALCELARELGLVVDLEFMPFRPVATLAAAIAVATRAGGPRVGAHVLVDALHLARSGGVPADLAAAPPTLFGVCHLCDAPAAPPATGSLVDEARGGRLLPGEGALPLEALVRALAPDTTYVSEVPLGLPRAALPALERARLVHAATARLLESRGARPPGGVV